MVIYFLFCFVLKFFAWNLIGGITITAWCLVLITIVLAILWGIGILRISKDFEGEGEKIPSIFHYVMRKQEGEGEKVGSLFLFLYEGTGKL